MGLAHEVRASNSRQALEEAMYGSLEVVTPRNLVNAYQQLDQYVLNNSLDKLTQAFALGAVTVGTAFVASGIYNLAKNYKTETRK